MSPGVLGARSQAAVHTRACRTHEPRDGGVVGSLSRAASTTPHHSRELKQQLSRQHTHNTVRTSTTYPSRTRTTNSSIQTRTELAFVSRTAESAAAGGTADGGAGGGGARGGAADGGVGGGAGRAAGRGVRRGLGGAFRHGRKRTNTAVGGQAVPGRKVRGGKVVGRQSEE